MSHCKVCSRILNSLNSQVFYNDKNDDNCQYINTNLQTSSPSRFEDDQVMCRFCFETVKTKKEAITFGDVFQEIDSQFEETIESLESDINSIKLHQSSLQEHLESYSKKVNEQTKRIVDVEETFKNISKIENSSDTDED